MKRMEERRKHERRECGVCAEPGRYLQKFETLEKNMDDLWKKWDGIQKLLVRNLIATVFTLLSFIATLAFFIVKSAAGGQ
jgi:hypothetical protein